MKTAKRMTPKPITVAPQDSLAKAKALMDSGNFRHLLVLEDGRLIGILSDRDMRLHSGYLDSTRVDAVMTSDPVTIEPTTTVEEATRLMLRLKISAVPVVDFDRKPVGILSTSDILWAFLDVERSEEMEEFLRQAVVTWTYVESAGEKIPH
jgi:acetoin utilization protein AcuB